MKKLLSILASSTLMIAAPLSVVACQKETSKIKEFDFADLEKKFLGITELVFQQNLAENFENLFYLSEKEASQEFSDFDFNNLWDHVGTAANGDAFVFEEGTKEFDQFSKFVDQTIDLDQLNKDANQRIVGNVNYRPLLKNGKNPFTSKIKIQKVSAVQKTKSESIGERILGFNFSLTTTVEYLDSTQANKTSDIWFESTMTIFENEETSNSFWKIADDLQVSLASKEYANSFIIESNSYDSEKISQTINTLSNFNQVLENIVKDKVFKNNLDNQIDYSKFNFKTERVQQVVNPDHVVLAQQFAEKNDKPQISWKKDYYQRIDLIKDLLKSGGETIDDAAKEMSRRNSVYSNAYISKGLKAHLKKDKVSSEVINAFNMWAYYDDLTSLRNAVLERKINLNKNLENEEELRTIGLYGTQIRSLQLNYTNNDESVVLDLPVQFIVHRQHTTFANTQLLHDEYTKANLIFAREIFGFADKDSIKADENFDYTYEFKLAEKMDDKIEIGKSYDSRDIFIPIVEETIAKLEKQKEQYKISSFEDYINGFGLIEKQSYLKVNEAGYIYLYLENGNPLGYLFSTSYSTGESDWEYQGPDSYINFNLGIRDDVTINEFGEGKTPWKFKL
ncbi:hypothetical protein [Spiroplasma alleghenense]|uniref:Lipoprotein n=1 Tax=Spiroplasma alleghenense TaxID=216931 RepID=A0A345Z4K7_9MOLU|nr:hypothetical protein [Spiroplasma alleghenense]AXK51536.1 hypothetical protein SALLE_v1c08660 [Spiroplasma alleghenense]